MGNSHPIVIANYDGLLPISLLFKPAPTQRYPDQNLNNGRDSAALPQIMRLAHRPDTNHNQENTDDYAQPPQDAHLVRCIFAGK